METPATNKFTWQKAGLLAAIVVLICFFMPWVEMGVSFIKTSMSGWQLAMGSGPAGISTPSWPSLLLIPLGMLAVVVTLGAPLIGQPSPIQALQGARRMAQLMAATGGLSLLVLAYQYYNLSGQFNRNWVGALAETLVVHTFGWTLTLLGSTVVLAAGVLELRTVTSPDTSQATPRVGSWMDQ